MFIILFSTKRTKSRVLDKKSRQLVINRKPHEPSSSQKTNTVEYSTNYSTIYCQTLKINTKLMQKFMRDAPKQIMFKNIYLFYK